MDTFMDKLAQKLNSQDVIRGNLAAEAAETERLKEEVEAYRKCLQEMRQIGLANAETADKMETLVNNSLEKIDAIQVEAKSPVDFTELAKNQEDFTHKECVKVYRNVQAAITEESAKQTEEIVAAAKKAKNRATVAMSFSIVAVSLIVIEIVLQLLAYFGVFPV